jgi:alpha-methylacyl-CoA racemase
VLSLTEATRHPHNVARGTYVAVDGIVQPAPAPRFSRTPSAAPRPPASAGTGAASALAEWNVPAERVSALCAAGVLRVGPE